MFRRFLPAVAAMLVIGVATSSVALPPPPPVQAFSAAGFIDSLGVNTHIDAGGYDDYFDATKVGNELAYIGVHHVRDGTPYDWALPVFIPLAQAGIKFDLGQGETPAGPFTTVNSAGDIARTHAFLAAVPGSVESLEGANEYNNWHDYTLNGVHSNGDLPWGVADDADLRAAKMADPLTATVTQVAACTAGVPAGLNVMPNADAGCWHVYGGPGQVQLGPTMAQGVAAAKATAPGQPVFVTETGIASCGYTCDFWGVASERGQAIVDINALLSGFADGAARTFIYELMDSTDNPDVHSNTFGLFHSDATPKPAATALHNLTTILSTAVPGTVTPGRLQYNSAGLPSTASSMVLQKSDGRWDIVIWNGGAVINNGSTDVTPPPARLVFSVVAPQQQISVFDPMVSANPIRWSTQSRIVWADLSADPVIIELTPNPAPAAARTAWAIP